MASVAAIEAVKRGARVLDAGGPLNWREKINVDTLDIVSTTLCPLGQVFGRYWDGRDRLAAAGVLDTNVEGYIYGFSLETSHAGPSNDDLIAAWTDEVLRGSRKTDGEPCFTLSELRSCLENGVSLDHRVILIKNLLNSRDPDAKKVTVELTVGQLKKTLAGVHSNEVEAIFADALEDATR